MRTSYNCIMEPLFVTIIMTANCFRTYFVWMCIVHCYYFANAKPHPNCAFIYHHRWCKIANTLHQYWNSNAQFDVHDYYEFIQMTWQWNRIHDFESNCSFLIHVNTVHSHSSNIICVYFSKLYAVGQIVLVTLKQHGFV